MRDYLKYYCDTYGIEPNDESVLLSLFDRIFADRALKEDFLRAHDILLGEEESKYSLFSPLLRRTEEITRAHRYTTDMLAYICGGKALRDKYEKLGLDLGIWFDTMNDVAYKYRECLNVYGIPGVFTEGWHAMFFTPARYALGRLQFEPWIWDRDIRYRDVKCGDPAVLIHIPSSGKPFDREARIDSYRRAYRFFADSFPGGKITFCTHSWLLFGEHKNFLKGCPNILDFANDFDAVVSEYDESRHDLWRIFNTASMNVEDYPTDTALRRSYADYLKAGGVPGAGFGVFIMDGEDYFERREKR